VNDVDRALLTGWFHKSPADCARLLPRLTSEETGGLLASLGTGDLAQLLRHASVWWLKRVIAEHPSVPWEEALERAGTDPNPLRLLRLLDRDTRERLLRGLSRRRHARITRALALPREQVVAVTDDRIPVARPEEQVSVVVDRMRAEEPRGSWLYLITDAGRYLGQVTLAALLDAENGRPVAALHRSRFDPLPAGMPLADAVKRSDWRETDTLPVADADGALLGAARFASLVQAIELASGEEPKLPNVPALLMASWLDVLAAFFARSTRGRGTR